MNLKLSSVPYLSSFLHSSITVPNQWIKDIKFVEFNELFQASNWSWYDDLVIHSNAGGAAGAAAATTVIKCPLCRTENGPTDIFNIKGNEDKCSVCYDNNVEKYFSKCN